jgi:hypothetical protein
MARASLPRPCGPVAFVGLGGRLHAIGGAFGDSGPSKKSVDWYWGYDRKLDNWEARAPLPTARDHTGTLVVGNLIHVVGDRVESFHTNPNLHHAYGEQKDRWEPRSPLLKARSGHGAVW